MELQDQSNASIKQNSGTPLSPPNIFKFHHCLIKLNNKTQTKPTLNYADTVFDRKIATDNKLNLIDQHKVQKMKKQAWYIHQNSFQLQNWSEVFSYIIQARCYQLSLHANYLPQILHTIQIQKWSKMKFLSLAQNNINNIESLFFIDMPQIQQINFENNYVTQLKPLQKLQWKKISGLFITQNPILQINLSKMKFDSAKLVDLRLFSQTRRFYQGIAFSAKLQTSKPSQNFQYRFYTIYSNKIERCLSQKFGINLGFF